MIKLKASEPNREATAEPPATRTGEPRGRVALEHPPHSAPLAPDLEKVRLFGHVGRFTRHINTAAPIETSFPGSWGPLEIPIPWWLSTEATAGLELYRKVIDILQNVTDDKGLKAVIDCSKPIHRSSPCAESLQDRRCRIGAG